MATQQIEFEAPSGMTLTAKLYTSGSDTVAYTASAVTEQTNRKGVYRATFSNVAANTYQLVATVGASSVAVWWGYAQNSNATYQFGSSVAGVWDELMTNHSISGSYGSHIVRSANQNQNTVQITGSQHIAADIHELQPNVINASHIATNAIDADALATDAVNEIAAAVGGGGGAGGAGSISVPFTVNDNASNPIDGVALWVSTDSAGTNVIAGTIFTNGSGLATFMLDPGSYYVWLQRNGYNFTNPQTLTVT